MKFEIFQDKKSLWRWRLVAANGKTIADSGEGYDSKSNVKRAIKTLADEMVNFKMEIIEIK